MRAVNLLPSEPARQRAEKRSARRPELFLVFPALAVVVVAVLWVAAGGGLKDKRSTLSGLQQELASIPKPRAVSSSALATQREQRVGALASVLGTRLSWDRILGHVASILPSDVWLTAITSNTSPPVTPTTTTTATTTSTSTTSTTTTSTTPTAPALTTSTPPASGLQIQGYTYSHEAVARFLARLTVLPDLNNVGLESSTLVKLGKRMVVQFTIVAGIQPGVPSS